MNYDSNSTTGGLLAEMLEAMTRAGGPRRNRAVFLALRAEIEEAMRGGLTMKDIWQHLKDKGRITMAYTTFRSHCRASGLKRTSWASRGPQGPQGPQRTQEPTGAPAAPAPAPPRRFDANPQERLV